MRYLSVCAGIEAATQAWHTLSWQPVAFSEIDKFPSAVLAHHYPNVPNWGDMTKFKEWPDATVDVLVGGTPCQSFSVAGLRKGLADPRGNLALTYLAIADKYRPAWLVWENVPGVLSADGGRAFGAILGGMGQLGYGFAYRVLDAQFVRTRGFPGAVPQRRRRVFVVAHLGDWRRAAAVLFDAESLRGNPPPGREAGKAAPTIPARSTAGGGLGTDLDCDGGCVTHSLRGEGFDASEDGTGRGTPIVPETCGSIAACSFTGGAGGRPEGAAAGHFLPECAPTMRAGGNRTGGDRPPGTDVDTCESLIPVLSSGQANAELCDNLSPALNCNRDGAPIVGQPAAPVAFRACDYGADAVKDVAPTMRSISKTGNHQAGTHGLAVATPMAVRRLTPVECERLQGFPDNFTRIPWRNKPAEQCPDGPRYKALGNSMAVPCMEWIGQRIRMVNEI